MRLSFGLSDGDGECRCKKCGKMLCKIKTVEYFACIEIKCTRPHCKTLNTFEIIKNKNYTGNQSAGSEGITT